MDPLPTDRWQHLNALLDEALDLSPDEREAFLDRIEDADTRYRLKRLLRAEADAQSFLNDEAANFAMPLLPSLPDELAGGDPTGQRLGAYRIGAEVGHGGMGRVFRAERDDGAFHQTVALKLLRPGLDLADAAQRFRFERRVLASLDHPNIARLLDGGVSDEGQPFLAMEFIEGQPINAYCDAQQLPVAERLRLFTTVGEAVHYAHQNLIVHRDLKPSNVFVTPEGADGRPSVKLLDFGIAKLLEDESPLVTTPLTQTGQRWMTPEYAAPEQITGAPITTATDVYQLGVVLYELLTGRRPFEQDERGLRGVEQAVLESEPEKPSTAVSRATGTPSEVSQARSSEPERLSRTLRGDLDTMVLKALAKEPAERYASAEAFVEDVKRYLAGLPVEARKPTVGYRLRRFVHRHQVGVAAAALVVLALVGGLGAALWQAEVARTERDQAEALAVFLENLFTASDPYAVERLDTLRVQALVERGQAQVETELADQPVLQARMLNTLGGAYLGMQQLNSAEAVLEHALDLRRQHLGERHEATAKTMLTLAKARMMRDGDSAVVASVREALSIQRERLGNDHPDVAMTLLTLARSVSGRSTPQSLAESDTLLHEALTILRSTYPGDHPQTVYALASLAEQRRYTWDRERIEEAVSFYRESLAMSQRIYGEQHPQTSRIQALLGVTLLRVDRPEEAEQHLRAGLAVERPLLGDAHPHVYHGLTDLARAAQAQGRYDEAETLLREALPHIERPVHRSVTLGTLATLLRAKGDLAGATEVQRDVLQLSRAELGPEHPMLAYSVGKLGDLLTEQARYAEAERTLLDGLAPLQAALGDDDPSVQELLRKMAALCEAWGKPDEAARYRDRLTGEVANPAAH